MCCVYGPPRPSGSMLLRMFDGPQLPMRPRREERKKILLAILVLANPTINDNKHSVKSTASLLITHNYRQTENPLINSRKVSYKVHSFMHCLLDSKMSSHRLLLLVLTYVFIVGARTCVQEHSKIEKRYDKIRKWKLVNNLVFLQFMPLL